MQSHGGVNLNAEMVTESRGTPLEFFRCFAEEIQGKCLVSAYTNLVRCLQPGRRIICLLIPQDLFQNSNISYYFCISTVAPFGLGRRSLPLLSTTAVSLSNLQTEVNE